MLNLKKLCLRSSALAIALVVAFCCAMPAFGATTTYYAPIPFETLAIATGSQNFYVGALPLVGGDLRSMSSSSSYVPTADGTISYQFSSMIYGESTNVNMTLNYPEDSSVTATFALTNRPLSYSALNASDYTFAVPTVLPDDYFTIRVRYTVRYFELSGSEWVLRSASVNSAPVSTTASVDVCNLIVSSMPTDVKVYDIIWFDSLAVDVSAPSSSPITIAQAFRYDGVGYPTTSNWIDQYNLSSVVNPVIPGDTDFVGWLVGAIGGFLDFEIMPGLSLNAIMYFVFGLGIALFFVKLIN